MSGTPRDLFQQHLQCSDKVPHPGDEGNNGIWINRYLNCTDTLTGVPLDITISSSGVFLNFIIWIYIMSQLIHKIFCGKQNYPHRTHTVVILVKSCSKVRCSPLKPFKHWLKAQWEKIIRLQVSFTKHLSIYFLSSEVLLSSLLDKLSSETVEKVLTWG